MKRPPLRVLYLTTSFPRFEGDYAGAFIYNLSRRLSKKGIIIEVICPHAPGLRYRETWDNIRIFRLPYFYPVKHQRLCYGGGIPENLRDIFSWIQLPFFILTEVIYALWMTKRGRFDLIHAHWSLPQGLAGFLCKAAFGVPYITTVHGSDIYGLKHALVRELNAKVIKYSDACTANSEATASAIRRLARRPDVEIVPMVAGDAGSCGSLHDADGLRREMAIDGRVVLFIGRLIDLKGADHLVKAIPSVLESCPDIKTVLVGSGPQEAYLKDLSRRLGLEDTILFVGQVPQEKLPKFYSIASILVLPSIVNERGETEGLGLVLLEAMASRVPVIGSDVGGITDIIKDGETGLLARQKDHNDLAEKIIRLLSDEELRNRVIENGLRSIEQRFSGEVIANRFIDIYRNVTNKRAGTAESLPCLL